MATITGDQTVHIHEEDLKGLNTLKDEGLLKLLSNNDDFTLCTSWPVDFDENGHVIFLDLGGKRLYKGLSSLAINSFEKFSYLTTLNLAGTDLPLSNIISILSQVSDTIESLFIGGNGLGKTGGEAIGTWLRSTKKLVKLDLRYNDIGGEGIEFICIGLRSTSLKYLYVEGNQIGDRGAMAIANLLKVNNTIHGIFLGANQIQSRGAIGIASSLKDNKTLSKIYLEGNNIGLEGADGFSIVLEELNGNTGLKNLFVDNNNIGKEGTKRLSKALKSETAIGDSLLE